MNIFGYIRRFFNPIHKTSVGFYESSHAYTVSFSTEIQNILKEAQSCIIVLPAPFVSDYQILQDDLIFSPEGYSQSNDAMYHNKYISWQMNLPAHESAAARINFKILVKSRKIKIESISGMLEDYSMLSPELRKLYLRENKFLNPSDGRIQSIVQSVIGEEKRIGTIIQKLNAYVVSRLAYGNPISGLYSFQEALEKEKVDCGGFDTLLGSLLMAVGIPVRIVSGFFAGYAENSMHAWLEALLPNNTWIPLDPSMEKIRHEQKTKKSGEFGFVGSDRIALSVGCDFTINIEGEEARVDILQNPLVFNAHNYKTKTAFLTSRVQ